MTDLQKEANDLYRDVAAAYEKANRLHKALAGRVGCTLAKQIRAQLQQAMENAAGLSSLGDELNRRATANLAQVLHRL